MSKISPSEMYKRWHWGKEVTDVWEYDDSRLPSTLIGIGRLWELYVNEHPRLDRTGKSDSEWNIHEDAVILGPELKDVNENYVLFDPDHSDERIYFVLSEEMQQDLQELYQNLEEHPIVLSDLAKEVGGKHGKDRDYPYVIVKPLGYLSHLAYWTHKEGDYPPSPYVHEMGEGDEGKSGRKIQGFEPLLAVSEDGNLWLAGGSYTCPVEGITN